MSALEFAVAAGTGGFLVLLGCAAGARARPLRTLKRAAQAVRSAMPQGKGEVVRHSDEKLAEMEAEARGWDKPHDPNEGVPGWPG